MQLKLLPYKLKKAAAYWRHYGTSAFWQRVMERLEPEEVPYASWFEAHRVKDHELAAQRRHPIADGPLISVVVPVYRTPERFLMQLIDCMKEQSYDNWELVLADAGAAEEQKERRKKGRTVAEVVSSYMETEKRIRYLRLERNFGIAGNTNIAVSEARGEYIGFMDHDDLLEPDALYVISDTITSRHPDLLYTDEDKVTADLSKYYQPHMKPEFNPDLLRSNNYITHFLVVKKTLADAAGPFEEEMNGAQDYDFIFRCTEQAKLIVRIPRVLYHWRTHEKSTADNPLSKQYAYEAGKRAIEKHLARTGTPGTVELLPDYGFYRVHYPVQGQPKISVLIPNKDHPEMLEHCITSLLDTGYEPLEIIVIENNSTERATFEYYRKLSADPHIKLVRWKKQFNYSAINNYGFRFATGEYILLLNNDVRTMNSTDWLTEMLGVCQRPEVGAVGARLYYPDNRIQHAGVVVGMGGIAGAMFVDLPKGKTGYLHKSALLQDVSAVTAACMLVKSEVYRKVNGLNEDLAVAFNDIDFCLKVVSAGYRIVYDPYAELYHDESRTRGPEDTPEKIVRFQGEIETFKRTWPEILRDGDPMYNPNLSLKKWNYSLKV